MSLDFHLIERGRYNSHEKKNREPKHFHNLETFFSFLFVFWDYAWDKVNKKTLQQEVQLGHFV